MECGLRHCTVEHLRAMLWHWTACGATLQMHTLQFSIKPFTYKQAGHVSKVTVCSRVGPDQAETNRIRTQITRHMQALTNVLKRCTKQKRITHTSTGQTRTHACVSKLQRNHLRNCLCCGHTHNYWQKSHCVNTVRYK